MIEAKGVNSVGAAGQVNTIVILSRILARTIEFERPKAEIKRI